MFDSLHMLPLSIKCFLLNLISLIINILDKLSRQKKIIKIFKLRQLTRKEIGIDLRNKTSRLNNFL
jgi:hypothetical protein